jgi:hypothetical protein
VITKLSADELTKLGVRFRASYLLQQAGYTLGIAAADGTPLAALLPQGYLDEVGVARDDVVKASQDKANVASESKQATSTQEALVRAAKVWRRKAAKRAQRALRQGANIPEELTHVGRAQSVPVLLGQVGKALALLSSHASAIDAAGPPTQPLIDEGTALRDALQQADARQEQARLSELPASVRAFYAKKGELYTGLKVINDAGHELHAQDAQTAAKYNLAILHRHAAKTTGEPAPTPAPTAAPA